MLMICPHGRTHSGMDRRNPDCRDAQEPPRPWSLGSGDPCRNDEENPHSTVLHTHLLLAHAAGSSPRSSQVVPMLRRWVEELAASLGETPHLADTAKPEEVEQAFARFLHRVSAQRRVVVLLDALNQFEPMPSARSLAWLPKPWPANARLVATTQPGPQADALARLGVKPVALPPLDKQEAEEIAHAVWRRYHRDCNPEVLMRVLGLQRPDGLPHCH